MTALAAAPVMNGHDSGTETGTEHSPSRFTAVNGREPVIGGNPGERGLQEKTNTDRRENRGAKDPDERLSQRSSPPVSSKNKRKRSESRDQESSNHEGDSSRSPGNRP